MVDGSIDEKIGIALALTLRQWSYKAESTWAMCSLSHNGCDFFCLLKVKEKLSSVIYLEDALNFSNK